VGVVAEAKVIPRKEVVAEAETWGDVAQAKVIPRKEVVAEAETWGDVAQAEAQEVVLEAWEPRKAEVEVRKGVPLTETKHRART
jgi:hypothetical protein